jgi:hypothetical protein
VQPSDQDGRALVPAIIVGPVLTARDAEAVAVWLEEGTMDPGCLAPHLRYTADRSAQSRAERRPGQ